ncbi:hypothetical protein [Bifidobacterium angulatum]|uniref:hypothetical protein n=1 Tax=Bifidobacterium angulatum TaxID=1683 RepID=UPI003B007209
MSNDSTTPSAAPLPIRTAHDGLALPAMGFGTYQVRGFAGAQAIASALENGYRLLDTAVNYENEGTVGKAIRMASSPRSCPDASTNTTRPASASRKAYADSDSIISTCI